MGRNRFQKMCALVLCVCMLAAMAACSGKGKEGTDNSANKDAAGTAATGSSGKERELVTFEVERGSKPVDPMVLDYIKEKFGIEFHYIEVADASTVMTQLGAGDVPDLVDGVKAELMSLDVENLFLPVSDYFDKLPNYVKYLEQDPDKECAFMLNDDGSKGKSYYLNYYRENPTVDYSVPSVREDLFKQTGLTELPKDYDELYVMLKKLKELDPENYPWTERDGTEKLLICNAFPFGTGYINKTKGMYYEPLADNGQGNWIYSPTKPEFRNLLIYFAKLYKEGLLDPDYATQKRDGMDQKYASGKASFFMENMSFLTNYETSLKETNPDAKFIAIPLLNNQVNQPRAVKGTYPYTTRGTVIKKDVKNLDRLLEYIDWCYSEEGILMTNWGIEGKSYTMADGKPEFIPAYADQFKSDANPLTALLKSFGGGLSNLPFYLDNDNEKYFSGANHLERAALVSSEEGIVFDRSLPPFTPEEKAKVDNYILTIDPVIFPAIEQTITNQITIEDYDKVVEQIIGMGANDLEAVYQQAYNRLQGK